LTGIAGGRNGLAMNPQRFDVSEHLHNEEGVADSLKACIGCSQEITALKGQLFGEIIA
jgi:hypothetical protein